MIAESLWRDVESADPMRRTAFPPPISSASHFSSANARFAIWPSEGSSSSSRQVRTFSILSTQVEWQGREGRAGLAWPVLPRGPAAGPAAEGPDRRPALPRVVTRLMRKIKRSERGVQGSIKPRGGIVHFEGEGRRKRMQQQTRHAQRGQHRGERAGQGLLARTPVDSSERRGGGAAARPCGAKGLRPRTRCSIGRRAPTTRAQVHERSTFAAC